MSTERRTVRSGEPSALGYRRLIEGPGEPWLVRSSRGVEPLEVPGWLDGAQCLLAVAHLSDLHVCDHQSPARVEMLNRYGDPDSPVTEKLAELTTYRPQELLTAVVLDAACSAVRATTPAAPFSGRPLTLAITTGDVVDNAQANELGWYLALLDGGSVLPDSGDTSRYEGTAAVDDPRYWHPDGQFDDLTRVGFGFPTVPGLLDAARRGFDALGLGLPWLAAHGNHDNLVQGTIAAVPLLELVATGDAKPVRLDPEPDPDALVELMIALAQAKPDGLESLLGAQWLEVTPDPARALIRRADFVVAHDRAGALPARHGFSDDNVGNGTAYYRYDVPVAEQLTDGGIDGSHFVTAVTFLILDTVVSEGGWQGSLDEPQLDWLRGELHAADTDYRYVILASHHTADTMVNELASGSAPRRVLGDELLVVLAEHRCVIAWLNGHTHANTLIPHLDDSGSGLWEITAASLIDWPQQWRTVELVRALDEDQIAWLGLVTTVVDHAGPPAWTGGTGQPLELAALSRELAANDLRSRDTTPELSPRRGRPADRNAILLLRDPFALT